MRILPSVVSGIAVLITSGNLVSAQPVTTGARQISVGVGNTPPSFFGDGSALSHHPATSPNSNLVVFSSQANNFVSASEDENSAEDVYQYSPSSGMSLISVSEVTGKAPASGLIYGGSNSPALSATLSDGSYGVVFVSDATDLTTNYVSSSVSANRNQIYLRLPVQNKTILISRAANATATQAIGGNADSNFPTIAAVEGVANRFIIAFRSVAGNLISTSESPPSNSNIYTVEVTLKNGQVTVGPPERLLPSPSADLNMPSLSGDGKTLVFSTMSQVVSGVTSAVAQVYAVDRASKQFSLISKTSSGSPGNGASDRPTISYSGGLVAFRTAASDLIANPTGFRRLVLLDRALGTYSQINTSSAGVASDGDVFHAALHPNGRYAAFSDTGNNLLGTTDSFIDTQAYFKDVLSGALIRVSVTSAGIAGTGSHGGDSNDSIFNRAELSIGSDGFSSRSLRVAYTSSSANLAEVGTPNGAFPFVFSSPVTGPATKLTRGATIEAPPDVEIIKVRKGKGGSDIKVSFIAFEADSSSFTTSGISALASSKARVAYALEIRKAGSKLRINRITSRNTATVRKLQPGRYVIRYRAVATLKKKIIRSKFSPKTTIVIPKS